MNPLVALGACSIFTWIYLIALHGRFWHAKPRIADTLRSDLESSPGRAPSVIAVVPARNEADVIERTITSLLDQRYPGDLRVILVDDHSDDETAAIAGETASRHPHGERIEIVRAPPRPAGWVGKMWAVESGLRQAREKPPDFFLLTDADIVHPPDDVTRLVARANAGRYDLVSLMVLLEHQGGWARLLIPAFVYFFQQLYPFPWVNNRDKRVAAAAGGTMLVRATALARAGGIESIRDAVIDDCALARRIKAGGPIWLGLTTRTRSIRPYRGIAEIWRMVARSAFSQLGYRFSLLVVTVFGLGLVYLAPPFLALGFPIHGHRLAAVLGIGAWGLMAASFVPTLRLYGRPAWLGVALPVAGLLYLGMTLDSARRHILGRGAEWKGRTSAGAT